MDLVFFFGRQDDLNESASEVQTNNCIWQYQVSPILQIPGFTIILIFHYVCVLCHRFRPFWHQIILHHSCSLGKWSHFTTAIFDRMKPAAIVVFPFRQMNTKNIGTWIPCSLPHKKTQSKLQQTPGTYPQGTARLMSDFLHQQVVEGPGVCSSNWFECSSFFKNHHNKHPAKG